MRARGKTAVVIDHDMQLINLFGRFPNFFPRRPGIARLCWSIYEKKDGMNKFLQALSITYRRDETTEETRGLTRKEEG